MTALILAAAAVRLLTFDRYLPFIDHGDEPVYYLLARNWRGITDDPFIWWRYGTYPPAYPAINVGVQIATEALNPRQWTLPPDYWYMLRLTAAWIGILTTAIMVACSWRLAGPLAGFFAGLVWGLNPIIVDNNSLALPDPYVYFGTAASILMAALAWRRQSFRWLFGSLLAALFAIYLKYSPIGALVPWGIVALWLVWRRRPHWQRAIPPLLAQGIVAAAAAFLIFAYGALGTPTREIETFTGPESLRLALDLDRNLNNWAYAILPLGMTPFALTLIVAIPAYLYSRRRHWRTISLLWIGILILASVIGMLMTATYTYISMVKIRHSMPTTIPLIVVWAMALAQVFWTGQDYVRSRTKTITGRITHWTRFAALPTAILLTVVIGGPPLAADIGLIRAYQETDIHTVVWDWANSSLPPDGLFLTTTYNYMEHVWNRDWSGYYRPHSFQWWLEQEHRSAPADYVKRGITYFMTGEQALQDYNRRPADKAFIDQLTLIKKIPLLPGYRGQPVYFYRMLPPQIAASFNYGNQILLVGYDLTPKSDKHALTTRGLSPLSGPSFESDLTGLGITSMTNSTRVKPGETIQLRPYWRIKERPASNYSVFVHLLPKEEPKLLAQDDGPPVSIARPTLTWDDPGELYIGRDISLTIPPETASGSYRMAIGLYDYVTGQRLTDETGKDSFVIEIAVEN
jgi:hypothetical protein